MKNFFKIGIATLLFILGIVFNYEYVKALNNDYVINKYNVDIVLNENNTFDITENITANFKTKKHGIIRNIPLKNNIVRLDGTTNTNKAQITNLSVNHKYTLKKEKNYFKIQIGDSNTYLSGQQEYQIKYTYNIGKDPIKDKDELYFNIIGNEWDTSIENITFTIKMPKEFDESKLGFSVGPKGSTNNKNINYRIIDNKIIGSYEGNLKPKEALTVRCEFPEGYFINAGYKINLIDFFIFIIPILGLLISAFLYFKLKNEKQPIKTVEFYPPSGLNSLEVGFLYKAEADNKDVISLLIYLANKGYIQIVENKMDVANKNVLRAKADKKIAKLTRLMNEEQKKNPNSVKIKYYQNLINVYENLDNPIDYESYGIKKHTVKDFLNNKDKYTIKKIKDYDGSNEYEKLFMEGLFPDGITITNEKLLNDFYITTTMILDKINNKKNKNKIIKNSILSNKVFIFIICLVMYIFISLPPLIEAGMPIYTESGVNMIFSLIVPIFFSFLFYPMIFDVEKCFHTGFIGVVFGIFLIILDIIILLIWPLFFYKDSIYSLTFLTGFISIMGILFFLKNLPNRTKYGIEILGKLEGFKEFLETSEKEKIESFILKNPTYFYDILPFAYVLKISDKWIEKFENISLQNPNWYDEAKMLNSKEFLSSMNNVLSNYQGSNSGSDFGCSSSSGGSSGGGSSGGGSGGGGGSSW